MIHASQLRHLARFKAPTRTVTRGDTTLTPFVEEFEAWIDLQPIGTVETQAGDASQGARLSLARMRYDSRVHRQLEMECRGRVFEIVSVVNVDERDIELALQVRELV